MSYFADLDKEKITQPDRINALMDPTYVSFDKENMEIVLEFTAKRWELNGVSVLHGGVISTMLDHVCGMCVCSYMESWCPTIELTTKFIRQITEGEHIIAMSKIAHAGKTILHAEGKLVSKETGKLLASCTGTYMNIQKDSIGQK